MVHICYLSCVAAIVLVIAMVYTNVMAPRNQMSGLSPEKKALYDRITKERLSIFYKGMGIGFILSLAIVLWNNTRKAGAAFRKGTVLTIVVGVTLLSSYFYYTLSPKSDYLLRHMETPAEREEWLKMYSTMKRNYHIGLLLGLVAVALFSNSICGAC